MAGTLHDCWKRLVLSPSAVVDALLPGQKSAGRRVQMYIILVHGKHTQVVPDDQTS
jgi:hypothetical protein